MGRTLDDVGARLTREELDEAHAGAPGGHGDAPLAPDTPDEKINDLVDYMMTLKGQAAAADEGRRATRSGSPDAKPATVPGKAHADAEQNAAGDPAKELAGTKLILHLPRLLPRKIRNAASPATSPNQQQEMLRPLATRRGGRLLRRMPRRSPGAERSKNPRPAAVHFAQAVFFQVPELPETTRWLHSSLLKESEPNLCFSCHGNIQAQFALPIHHRVPEGLMKCTDCHNPHGSINRASLNAPYWETCVKCHVEKRGPCVYEHAAVRVEGCIVCHNPHGSTNHFMLVRREGRQLCLQCHSGFHAQAGTPHSRLGFQDQRRMYPLPRHHSWLGIWTSISCGEGRAHETTNL